jgi:hypothetical protein
MATVEHHALAEHGIESALGYAGGAWAAGELPDQEAVIQAWQRVALVTGPDGALDPPVRRVQGVGVVAAQDPDAARLQLPAEL